MNKDDYEEILFNNELYIKNAIGVMSVFLILFIMGLGLLFFI